MRKMAWTVLALTGACGGSDGEGANRPLGTWWLEDPNGACAQFLEIQDGSYEWLVLCELADGGLAGQVEGGVYTLTDDALAFEPEYTSCDVGSPQTLGWSLDDGALVLRSASGASIWEDLDSSDDGDSAGSASVSFGCFGEDGWIAKPVRQL
jgi:hypothetical protein